MSEELYLGFSDRDYLPGQGSRIKTVAKLVDGSWKASSTFEDELPPKGSAFAIDPSLSWLQKDQLITFRVKPNHQIVRDGYDQYIVEQGAQPARPIIDYRTGGFELTRYHCIEVGFNEIDLIRNDVIIAIANDKCLCVTLTLDQTINRYVSRTGLGTAKIFALNSAIFTSDLIDGRLYEVPDQTVGEKLTEMPWKMDSDLLKDLLKLLQKNSQEGPSKKERESLSGIFNRAKSLAYQLPDIEHLEEWLPYFCDRMDAYLDAPVRIAETLIQIDPIKQQIEDIRINAESNLRNELEPLVRTQLEESYQELKEAVKAGHIELQALKDELHHKKTEKYTLEESYTSLQRELVTQIHRLNRTLGVVNNVSKQDFDELIKCLQTALGDYSMQLSPRLAQNPPWSLVQSSSSDCIRFDQLPDRLNKVALEAGITGSSMQLLDVGIRSGALVILPQAHAETMVPAYARAVSRGDFVRVPLGPSVLQLDDIWVHPAKEQTTGFALAWLEAEMNSDQIQLVWLDGLHRTPMDLWIPSLIGAINIDKRPSNFLIIASLENNLLDSNRVWKELPQVTFPIFPETQACGLSQFYRSEPNQTTYLDWNSNTDKLVDQDDFEDAIDQCDPNNYFALKAETAIYRALAKVSTSQTPISEQLLKMAQLRDQGRKWLAQIFE